MNTMEWEEEYDYNGVTYTMWSTITYELSGGWLRATRTDPAECPDVSVLKVVVDSIDDIPVLMDLTPLVNQYVADFDRQRDDLREKILAIEKAGDE